MTLAVALLDFSYWWVAMCLSLFWLQCSFFYGAQYYMNWFAPKYEERLDELTAH